MPNQKAMTISVLLESEQRQELDILSKRLAKRFGITKVLQKDAIRHALKYTVRNDTERE